MANKIITNVRNFFNPSIQPVKDAQNVQTTDPVKNVGASITPLQLERLRHDVKMWREAIGEAEQAYYPHRVRMQRMFVDTILNGHVYGLMEHRKDLTLLREFELVNSSGTVSKDLTQYFDQSEWFSEFVSHTLDALFYGYSLISLGDVVDDEFPFLSVVKRWNISPDRLNVVSIPYMLSGTNFLEGDVKKWHVYAKTPSENGQSLCGYGLFYKIALYEIYLRNTLGFNADFVELFAQPFRVAKTLKTDDQRTELEQAMINMGHSGYLITDPTDEIEFLETQLGGTGWKGYENLEQRCQKLVSKMILGHADAMDSVPGKLGSGQDADKSPVEAAKRAKQTKDGRYVESIVNRQLLPKMREIGFSIPEDMKLRYKNDAELKEIRKDEDNSNLITAQVAQTLKNAGLKVSAQYIKERTGIDVQDAPDPMQMQPQPGGDKNKPNEKATGDDSKVKQKPQLEKRVQSKLKKLYK